MYIIYKCQKRGNLRIIIFVKLIGREEKLLVREEKLLGREEKLLG